MVAAENPVNSCINTTVYGTNGKQIIDQLSLLRSKKTIPVLSQPIKMYLSAKKGDAYLGLLSVFFFMLSVVH